ncbi:MAG: hypothetical protein U9O41_09755 [Candidatus Aerophobetes bacterium]|nr:hypothetical protein [Candidatus Aerophobetes bacterium]
MGKRTLFPVVVLGIILLLSNQVLAWTIDDPGIKDLSGVITVRDYEGEEEFSLQFLYLNDRSMNYIWEPELVKETKKLIGDHDCLFLVVFVEQDSYFYPTSITFVQESLQYEIRYEDVVKASDTFSGHLRAGVKAFGFIFIPDGVSVYSPMKIYYNDDYTIFSVPVEIEPVETEKRGDVSEQIKKLEKEKAKLETDITLAKRRIEEINEEIKKLETKTKLKVEKDKTKRNWPER